jgi:hypothetical protein
MEPQVMQVKNSIMKDATKPTAKAACRSWGVFSSTRSQFPSLL